MARPGISTKNTEKIRSGPKFWTPRIYAQNTLKIPKKYPQKYQNAHFWYFFGIFRAFSWGSRISGRVFFFFWYFSWKFRVGSSRGSVAGQGVLNPKVNQNVFFKKVHENVPNAHFGISSGRSKVAFFGLYMDFWCFGAL